ncbi:MAG: LytR C-terminal domain-containing protein [Actinomycetia bacterium]|nr:LytR C-terminal domain-containing protein [Actinomycetes bacterium]
MTGVHERWDSHTQPSVVAESSSPRLSRFRISAFHRHPALIAFYVLDILLIVAIPWFAWRGAVAVLDSEGGTIIDAVPNADEPGYRAFVQPSPVHLVLQTDVGGRLTTALLVAGAGSSTFGGAVRLLPGATPLPPDQGGLSLGELYDAEPAGVGPRVEAILGFGVGTPIVLGPAELAAISGDFGPFEVTFPDAVRVAGPADGTGEDIVLYPSGRASVPASDLAAVLSALGTDEPEANRLIRQERTWEAWFAAAAASNRPVPDTVDADLATLLDRLLSGFVDFDTVPETEGSDGSGVLDTESLAAEATGLVPFPVGTPAVPRVRIAVLDGVGTTGLVNRVIPELVAAGAEISFVGTANVFGAETSTFRFAPGFEEQANALRAAVGYGTVVPTDPLALTDDGIDVTIVLGSDSG